MQQQRRRHSIIIGVLSLGLLAGVALTAGPAQAVDAVGPYYAMPSWDRKMASVNRFVVLTDWSSQAVLDKETGLVWERSPSRANVIWFAARARCVTLTTGNHKGWRLPSVHELASLVDPSIVIRGAPKLPLGHPFVLDLPIAHVHWSATTNAFNDLNVWNVNFSNGLTNDDAPWNTGLGEGWCVRGGMNAKAY